MSKFQQQRTISLSTIWH